MERLFDLQDKFRGTVNSKTNSVILAHQIINIGIEENPKNINMGVCCTEQEKSAFLKLFIKYHDAFTWTYKDLKTYDTRIIQHTIPMKENVKHVQQKLRKFHTSLEPRIKA